MVDDVDQKDDEDQNETTNDYKIKVKTELCKYWQRGKVCPF